MKPYIYKGVRFPPRLAQRIDRMIKLTGTNYSQFIRDAAMKELKRREKEVLE